MAYSVVPTAVTGDLWTAANHNTYIKDNFAATLPDAFTAAGDIPYASAADTLALLSIGTAGQVLRVNAAENAPEWAADFDGASVSTTDQNVGFATSAKVVFTTENYDTNSYWSTDNPDAIIVPYSGLYQFTGHATFEASSTDLSTIYYSAYLNSSTSILSRMYGYPGYETTLNISHIQYCSSGSDMYLTLDATSTSSSTDHAAIDVSFQVTWLGTT